MNSAQLSVLMPVLLGKKPAEQLTGTEKLGLLQAAMEGGLTENLYHQWKVEQVPPAAIPHYEQLEAQAQFQYLAYLQRGNAVAEIITVLREQKIPHVFFKGFSVAHQAYPHPYLRSMSDVDILIQPQDTEAVLSSLRAAGFQLKMPRLGVDHPFTAKYEHTFTLHRNDLFMDVHNQLDDTRGILHLTEEQYAWLFSQTREFELEECRNADGLRPELEFLYVGVHSLLHHVYPLTARNYVDLAYLARMASFDWRFLFDAAQRLGWEDVLAQSGRALSALMGDEQRFPLEQFLPSSDEVPSMEQYIAALRKRYTVRNAWGNIERGDRLRFFLRMYLLPAPQYIADRYAVKTLFGWPWGYLRFLFERAAVFLRMRFGIGNQ